MQWALIGMGALLAVYALAVLALVLRGRRGDARALAGLIPDCVVLAKRLLHDPRVSRRRKLLLGLLVGYLACPVDVVPDFIPIAGHLDDAIVAAVVFRAILRSAGDALLSEHWPGPQRSLDVVRRLTLAPAAR